MSQTQEQTAGLERRQAAPIGKLDLAVVSQPGSPAAEAYRSLRATVKFADLIPPLRSVLLADAGTDGQNPRVAANLAAALALAGDSSILLDAALAQPQIHQIFGVPNEFGAGEWLAAGDATASLPLIQTPLPGLRLLNAGHIPGQFAPSDLFSGERGSWLMERLHQEADFVVVNAAPLPEAADALAIAPRVDGVLLLVRSGKTKRVPAQRAKASLERVGARVLGAVLIDAAGRLG